MNSYLPVDCLRHMKRVTLFLRQLLVTEGSSECVVQSFFSCRRWINLNIKHPDEKISSPALRQYKLYDAWHRRREGKLPASCSAYVRRRKWMHVLLWHFYTTCCDTKRLTVTWCIVSHTSGPGRKTRQMFSARKSSTPPTMQSEGLKKKLQSSLHLLPLEVSQPWCVISSPLLAVALLDASLTSEPANRLNRPFTRWEADGVPTQPFSVTGG